VLRQPIYEKDRIDPLDPSASLKLDENLLSQFPEGYKHLAYIQTKIGYTVKRDMPMLKTIPRIGLMVYSATIASRA
jgi:hypothetical protein